MLIFSQPRRMIKVSNESIEKFKIMRKYMDETKLSVYRNILFDKRKWLLILNLFRNIYFVNFFVPLCLSGKIDTVSTVKKTLHQKNKLSSHQKSLFKVPSGIRTGKFINTFANFRWWPFVFYKFLVYVLIC